MKGARGLDKLARLMEVYFRAGGMQLQINVVDSGLLREAQTKPDLHAGLIVRVSGFSARFTTLCQHIQDEMRSSRGRS